MIKRIPTFPVFSCSECGKEITGEHVKIMTRRRTELHIHFGCMPIRQRGREQNGPINEKKWTGEMEPTGIFLG